MSLEAADNWIAPVQRLLSRRTSRSMTVAGVLRDLRNERLGVAEARRRLRKAGLGLTLPTSGSRAGRAFLAVPWGDAWASADERAALLAAPDIHHAQGRAAGHTGRVILVGFRAILGALPAARRPIAAVARADVQLVDQAARLIWGADWQTPLSDRFGLGLRRVQRLAEAARMGRAYVVPGDLLPGLCDELAAHIDRIQQTISQLGSARPNDGS